MAYVYQPYPKWITLADGRQIIVKDVDEHRSHAGCTPVPEGVPVPPLEPPPADDPADEKDGLIAQAENKGVKIDRRWSAARLKAAIEGAA